MDLNGYLELRKKGGEELHTFLQSHANRMQPLLNMLTLEQLSDLAFMYVSSNFDFMYKAICTEITKRGMVSSQTADQRIQENWSEAPLGYDPEEDYQPSGHMSAGST